MTNFHFKLFKTGILITGTNMNTSYLYYCDIVIYIKMSFCDLVAYEKTYQQNDVPI